MNTKQNRALGSLARALLGCQRAGIVICGMDDELRAYDGDEFRAARDNNNNSIYAAQRSLEGGVDVNSHGAYLDSGGW